MPFMEADAVQFGIDANQSEEVFFRRLQVRKLMSYTTIANAIMLFAAPSAYYAYGGDGSQLLGAVFLGTALISIVIRFFIKNWSQLERHINPVIFLFSILYLAPAAISTALRPEHESGRAIVLVGLACSTYCFSLRWFFALHLATALSSLVAWELSHASYAIDEFVVFFVAVPAVGYIIFSSHLSTLKRAYHLQHESIRRQRELELTLKHLTEETALRHKVEQLRQADETRLKEQHDQLVHASRLTTMGELVAGIAHELHQPLHATSMYVGVLEALTASDESPQANRLRELSSKIVSLTQQCAQIVRRMQNFVRRGPRVRVQSDLSAIIHDALELTATEIRHRGVRVSVVTPETGCIACVDPVQIQQVMVNLFRNACEAMHATAAGMRQIDIRISSIADRFEVLVSDTGPGFTDAQLSRVFNTFYSTKPEGLGMGLAISRTILEDHNGTIELLPNSPSGASFRISIPSAAQATEAAA